MKRTWFAIHSWLGLCLGLVLGVMGATGAIMAFADELSRAVDPAYYRPGVPVAADLGPDGLVARIEAGHPGYRVDRLDWEMDRALSHGVRLRPPSGGPGGQGAAPISGRVARDSGAFLPEPAIVRFFETVETVHRWLALPGKGNGWGRVITGAGAVALIGFALTGLALRWPRSVRQWRRLLVYDLKPRKGRLRVLHRVTGTWLLPLYLLSALTGLWWSSETYQGAARLLLTGKAEAAPRGASRRAAWRADVAWQAFLRHEGRAYGWVRITMQPGKGAAPPGVRLEARPRDARHDKAIDTFAYAAADGRPVSAKAYADKPLGEALAGSMLEVHRGAFFGLAGRIAMLCSSLLLPFFALTGLWFWWSRRPRPARPA